MSKIQQSEQERTLEQMENARFAHQAAISIWNYYGEVLWQKYNALLVAHSLVIAAIGLVLTSEKSLPILNWAFPVVGLVLSLVWLLITIRGTEYHIHFLLEARALERYLPDEAKLFSRGKSFVEDKLDKPKIDNGDFNIPPMSRLARLLPTRVLSYIVIFIFAGIYICVLVQNIIGWGPTR